MHFAQVPIQNHSSLCVRLQISLAMNLLAQASQHCWHTYQTCKTSGCIDLGFFFLTFLSYIWMDPFRLCLEKKTSVQFCQHGSFRNCLCSVTVILVQGPSHCLACNNVNLFITNVENGECILFYLESLNALSTFCVSFLSPFWLPEYFLVPFFF